MALLPDLLMATTSGDEVAQVREIVPWAGLLVVLTVVGFIIIMMIRRTTQSDLDGSSSAFTLQDLRRLHKSGEMTDDEFERAKEAVIGHLRKPETASEDGGDGVASDDSGLPTSGADAP